LEFGSFQTLDLPFVAVFLPGISTKKWLDTARRLEGLTMGSSSLSSRSSTSLSARRFLPLAFTPTLVERVVVFTAFVRVERTSATSSSSEVIGVSASVTIDAGPELKVLGDRFDTGVAVADNDAMRFDCLVTRADIAPVVPQKRGGQRM